MKKHFLLLIMAFFSLVGWAQTNISNYEIVLSSSNAVYDGTNKMPTVLLRDKDGIGEDIPSTKFNATWTDGETVVTELIDARPVTGYTVTVKADGTNTFSELAVETKKFYITKANNAVTNAPAVSGGGEYLEAGYNLVATAPTVTYGEVKYMVTGTADVPAATATGWTTTAPHASKPGTYYVYIMVDADVDGNYNALAPQKIAATNSVAITGTAIPGSEYEVPTAIGEDILFDNTAHALVNAGSATGEHCEALLYSTDGENWQTTVPQATIVGDYTVYYKIVAASENYYDVTGNFSAKIVKGTPTVTNATGAAEDALTYTGVAQPLLTAPGTATIGATPVYTIAYKATAAGPYGTAGDPVAYADVKGTNAGYYQITTKVVGDDNVNAATAAGEPIEVQIGKAELTVTPDNQTKAYGAAMPTFTASYTGFQNGETAETATGLTAPTMTCKESDEDGAADVTNATGVGTYKIKATAGTGSADNYTLVINDDNFGTLTITPKELSDADITFTLTDPTLEYTGEALYTTIATAKYGGTDLTSPADYSFITTNNINAGTANVIISGQGNYGGSVVKNFTITPKSLYAQPKNNSKAYGATEPDPISTYDLVDLSGLEPVVVEGATLNGTVTLARVAGENAGSYKIYVSAFELTEGSTANYTIAADQVINTPASASAKNLTALFTVQPAEGAGLVLKFKSDVDAAKKTKVYGDANPAWTIDDLEYVSGAVGTDDWASIKPTLSAPTFKLASENVVNEEQNQVLLQSGLVSTNYPNVTVQPMDFTVTARPITVTVEDQAITYGAALTAANYGVNWSITDGDLKAGEAPAVLELVLSTVNDLSTYGVATDPYEGVIDASSINTNYALTVNKGDLSVSSGTAIELNREGDMDALISAYDGQNINVTLDRNITRTEAWFAMVLPFETSVTELSQQYGYAVVNVLDEANTDASKVKFKLHMQTIEANQPFLIKIATAKETAMDFGAKDIVYAADPESHDAAGNEFHGVFKSTELAASNYLWVMVPSKNKFNKLNASGTTLTPINAYLKTKENLDAFAPVITIEDFDFESGTTSIKALNTETMNAYSTDGWYNLNGVKLQGVPTQKGVYIQKGKKVIIK